MSGRLFSSCATGGGSRSGGVLVPLGTAVPWGDSPKVQGGPWAPPPCGDKSSETLLVLCLVFARFFWDGCWVFRLVLLVSGVGMLFGFVALQDLTPVSHDVCCPLFLFLWLFGMFADVVFFLFFSFSQALGKPKSLLGFGIPLVFLHHGRALRLRSVLRAPHLHSCQTPHLCFFLSSSPAGTVAVGCALFGFADAPPTPFLPNAVKDSPGRG